MQLDFFPSKTLTTYLARLFIVRILAVLVMLVLVLMMLDLPFQDGRDPCGTGQWPGAIAQICELADPAIDPELPALFGSTGDADHLGHAEPEQRSDRNESCRVIGAPGACTAFADCRCGCACQFRLQRTGRDALHRYAQGMGSCRMGGGATPFGGESQCLSDRWSQCSDGRYCHRIG